MQSPLPDAETKPLSALLIALVVLLFGPMLLRDAPYSGLVTNLLFTLVLVAGVWVASEERWHRLVATGLGGLAIVSRWVVADRQSLLALGADLIVIGFLAFVTTLVALMVFRQRRVDLDTVAGGICVYLLIGVIWAVAMVVVYDFDNSAFHGLDFGTLEAASARRFEDFLYLSLVTLTTLGYGDITPVSPAARALTTSEAILGQLYLTVFIAGLVGMAISQGQGEDG